MRNGTLQNLKRHIRYPARNRAVAWGLGRFAGLFNPKVVFIWIPKNAGTSVWRALHRRYCPKLKTRQAIEDRFVPAGFVTFGHQSYPALVEAGYVTQPFDAEALKFCVCRNPFDRMVSLFRYLRPTGPDGIPLSFGRFVDRVCHGDIAPVGPYHVQGLSQCNPQVDWITDGSGNIFVDEVLRYERLRDDWDRLLSRLGVRLPLPHRNRSGPGTDYRRWYNAATARMVADRYAADFQLFRYSPTLDARPQN